MHRWLPLANLAAKALGIAFALYPLLRPDRPQFARKAMRARALSYPLAPSLVPLAWWRAGRPAPYPHAADAALSLPLILDGGANAFDLYRRLPKLDLAVHAANAALLGSAAGAAIAPLLTSRWLAAALIASFGISAEALWELAEYAALKSGEHGMELTYENTMHDVLASTIGAVAGGAVTALLIWPRRGEVGRLFGWRLIEPDPEAPPA